MHAYSEMMENRENDAQSRVALCFVLAAKIVMNKDRDQEFLETHATQW